MEGDGVVALAQLHSSELSPQSFTKSQRQAMSTQFPLLKGGRSGKEESYKQCQARTVAGEGGVIKKKGMSNSSKGSLK